MDEALARCDREIAEAERKTDAGIFDLMQWADWHAERALILERRATSAAA